MKKNSYLYLVIFIICLLFLVQVSELPLNITGYALVLTILVILSSILILLKDNEVKISKWNYKVFIPLVGVLLFSFSVSFLGWFLSLFGLLLLFQIVLNAKFEWKLVLSSSLWTVVSYLLFEKVLNLNFPLGSLWGKL